MEARFWSTCLVLVLLLSISESTESTESEIDDNLGIQSEEDLLNLLEDAGIEDLENIDFESLGIDLEDLLNNVWAQEDDQTALPDDDYLGDEADWSEPEGGWMDPNEEMDDDTDPVVYALTGVLEEMYSSIAHGGIFFVSAHLIHQHVILFKLRDTSIHDTIVQIPDISI